MFYHTKGYLGEKDAYVFPFYIVCAITSDYVAVANGRGRNEFGIPDVPYEPYLLLYPHITILALLFADQSFRYPFPNFTEVAVSSSDCSRVEVVAGVSEGGDSEKTSIPTV